MVLPCPFKPGALLQYYAVVWRKDSIDIAELLIDNSKYRIDGATYALIIDPVSVNDTSSNYQCRMFVTNPITNNKQELQFYPQLTSDVSLSLTVVATSKFNPILLLLYRLDDNKLIESRINYYYDTCLHDSDNQ